MYREPELPLVIVRDSPNPSPPLTPEPAEVLHLSGGAPEEFLDDSIPLIIIQPPTPRLQTPTELPLETLTVGTDTSYASKDLATFFSSLASSMDRRLLSASLRKLCNSMSISLSVPCSVLQMTSLWLSQCYTKSPIVDTSPSRSAFIYKVANKTRPVATTLPEDFRIICRDHPNPLANMSPLPTRPPDFYPTGRITQQHCDQMAIGKDFLFPEEIKLVEWIICAHDTAFAWTDEE